MATIKTLVSGNRKLVIQVTGSYAGDGNSDLTDEVIVNRSTLTGPDGINIPTYVRVDEVTWTNGAGYAFILLEFDDGTDEAISYFHGPGYIDFRSAGGISMSAAPTTATEGDIIMTTSGGAAGDSYTVLLNCTLKD